MNVLAVGCHPDDLEIACGGTLAKYTEQGANVYMCHAANGNMGHAEILPEPLAKIRKEEAENAGKVLGAKEVFSLDVGDILIRDLALRNKRCPEVPKTGGTSRHKPKF